MTALAFSITMLIWLSDRKPLSQVVRPAQFQDLGSFLLTFVMLWAYLEFSQFLIIWGGDLSDEIPWYLRRMEGVWGHVGMLLVILSFAFPFFLLLFRHVKRRTRSLMIVAVHGSVDAPGGYVLDGIAGVRRRQHPPQLDGCGACRWAWAESGLLISSGNCSACRFCRCTIRAWNRLRRRRRNMDKHHDASDRRTALRNARHAALGESTNSWS